MGNQEGIQLGEGSSLPQEKPTRGKSKEDQDTGRYRGISCLYEMTLKDPAAFLEISRIEIGRVLRF